MGMARSGRRRAENRKDLNADTRSPMPDAAPYNRCLGTRYYLDYQNRRPDYLTARHRQADRLGFRQRKYGLTCIAGKTDVQIIVRRTTMDRPGSREPGGSIGCGRKRDPLPGNRLLPIANHAALLTSGAARELDGNALKLFIQEEGLNDIQDIYKEPRLSLPNMNVS